MKKEKYILTRDREQPLSPFYWVMDCYTLPLMKKTYGIERHPSWFVFRDNRYSVFYKAKDWQKWSNHIGAKLYKDKAYFTKIKKAFDKEMVNSKVFFKTNSKLWLGEKNFEQLIKQSEKIKDNFQAAECVSTSSWFIGGDVFGRLLKEDLGVNEEDFVLLTMPKRKTFVSHMEYDILKGSLLVLMKKKNINDLAKKLTYDYGCLPFNYNGPEYWNEDYFIKKIREEIKLGKKKIQLKIQEIDKKDELDKKKRLELLRKYRITKKQKEIIDRFRYVAMITDDRKLYLCRYMYLFAKIAWEIERRYGFNYKNLCYLFLDEIEKIPEQKEKMLTLSQERIDKPFILASIRIGKHKILSVSEEKKIFKEIDEMQKAKEIKGIIASMSDEFFYSGKAKVLMSAKDCIKVDKGDIVVATMTTPAYIAAMKKAAGIITDEGGITCHAAIICREMGKPCIIGTKVATDILNDGDIVKMDMKTGIVKILK